MTRRPPHIHVRKDSSKFSPPHISISSSYEPNSKKYLRSMANSPPAIVGESTAVVGCFLV